jgi:hypothetical protein
MTIAPAPIHFAWPTNSIMMSLPWGTGTTGWRNGKRAPMVRPRPLARQRHLAPADQPHVGDGVVGARHGRVVMKAVGSPLRPATRWRRVVSRASARVRSGRIVVSRRASIDFPAPGGPSSRRFGPEHRHPLQLYERL